MSWSKAITDWQLATFGAATPPRALRRFREELDELLDAPESELAEEAADVVIMLAGWVKARTGEDLAEAVERKMAINRARKWDVRGDGTGYHIK